MRKVEFRLLQVIMSPVSGDRVTVALVHWDGSELRIAASIAGLVAVDKPHREGIRIAIEQEVRSARRRAKEVERGPVLDIGLRHLHPVREGFGAALFWTPVVSMEVGSAAAHFAEMARELRLDRPREHRTQRVTIRIVHDQLAALGETLKHENATRVRVDYEIKLRMVYRPPFSWKNGKWHHSVPLSLDGLDRDQIDDEIQRTYGLVDLSFPRGHVPVVVAATTASPALKRHAETELKMLESTLRAKHGIDLVIPKRRDKLLGLEPFAASVRRDIKTAQ